MNSIVKSVALTAAFALAGANQAQAFSVALSPVHTGKANAAQVGVIQHCTNVPAAISGIQFIQIPTIAAEQGAGGTSGVVVELSSAGKLLSAAIADSSGNPNLDRAALQSARMTRFTPEIQNCVAVGGTYLYTVTF